MCWGRPFSLQQQQNCSTKFSACMSFVCMDSADFSCLSSSLKQFWRRPLVRLRHSCFVRPKGIAIDLLLMVIFGLLMVAWHFKQSCDRETQLLVAYNRISYSCHVFSNVILTSLMRVFNSVSRLRMTSFSSFITSK